MPNLSRTSKSARSTPPPDQRNRSAKAASEGHKLRAMASPSSFHTNLRDSSEPGHFASSLPASKFSSVNFLFPVPNVTFLALLLRGTPIVALDSSTLSSTPQIIAFSILRALCEINPSSTHIVVTVPIDSSPLNVLISICSFLHCFKLHALNTDRDAVMPCGTSKSRSADADMKKSTPLLRWCMLSVMNPLCHTLPISEHCISSFKPGNPFRQSSISPSKHV
mmetsp:Transcript_46551/g.113362  ORF Transcript_46551/g.113362 Transcript_46551/m.113362 type:complete len:222 (+) Transcript_46551:2600-3265(+)